MQIPSEPWLNPREAHIRSVVYWQNFGLEHISNVSHGTLAALKKHGQEIIPGGSIALRHFMRKTDGFPSQALPSMSRTNDLRFPVCVCRTLGEGQLSCSTNRRTIFNGQGPLHSAMCFAPSSFSFGFKTLVYSKRDVVHVFLIHLHLNH